MVDDNESRSQRPKARKVPPVDAPDDTAGEVVDSPVVDGDELTAPRRPRRSRPFWRKGWFWVGVIVAEVVVVLVISFAFERSTTEVDLAGGDLPAFCQRAAELREEGLGPSPGLNESTIGDASRFERERDAYLALVPTAPDALVADLEKLAELRDQAVETTHIVAERKAADPEYLALDEITAMLDRTNTDGRVAAARVSLVLREQCAIDPSAEVTTTVPAPVVIPGTPGD